MDQAWEISVRREGVREVRELRYCSRRWDCRARMMICRKKVEVSSRGGGRAESKGKRRRETHLVVHVRDVHDKVYLVTKVVTQDPPHDILCHVVAALPYRRERGSARWRFLRAPFPRNAAQDVPSVTHVRRVVDGGTTVVPCYHSRFLGDEVDLRGGRGARRVAREQGERTRAERRERQGREMQGQYGMERGT